MFSLLTLAKPIWLLFHLIYVTPIELMLKTPVKEKGGSPPPPSLPLFVVSGSPTPLEQP